MMKRLQRVWAMRVGSWCVLMLSVVASGTAFAAAPQLKTQGPGFYRIIVLDAGGAVARSAVRVRQE